MWARNDALLAQALNLAQVHVAHHVIKLLGQVDNLAGIAARHYELAHSSFSSMLSLLRSL
jgi:hypothetical protein